MWNGKTNEVRNLVLPFQTIEQVDEPRAESGEKPRSDLGTLFDTDGRGRQLKGWTKKLKEGGTRPLAGGMLGGKIERQCSHSTRISVARSL